MTTSDVATTTINLNNSNSNSSDETVIARQNMDTVAPSDAAGAGKTSTTRGDCEGEGAGEKGGGGGKFCRGLLLLAAHLNPFAGGAAARPPPATSKANGTDSAHTHKGAQYLNLLGLAQRYFGQRHRASCDSSAAAAAANHSSQTRSAPVTPLRWARREEGGVATAATDNDEDEEAATKNQEKSRVRFEVKATAAAVGSREEEDAAEAVGRLFELGAELGTQAPMDSQGFRSLGYRLIDYIANYLDTIKDRRVTPLNIEPGYLQALLANEAPAKGEPFSSIMRDFEAHIMCGITHWQHPHFHAYFPAGNAYPSILADMLSDALGCVGFSWAASPAYTELEIIMLDWMGKMIGLPDHFLCLAPDSKGGGVIQGSASECVLVALLAARHSAMERLRRKYPSQPDSWLLSKLIGYCSREAHSCVEKAAMVGFIGMRALETDERHSLRGDTLARAIQQDRAKGLEPFLVCATLGTTSCCSFDNLEELGQLAEREELWLHVDAAYAGSALICPEFQHLLAGIERAASFNMNPNKWMLINFDCSLMWVRDRFALTRAFVVDPLYLQHSFSDQAIDYRHWGIPLSRRFRALKLWFTIRNYGVEGLQVYIRNHVRLAKLLEQLLRQDARFTIANQVELGLVCFRLVGSNALNQRLLSMINASGQLHMVPASLNGRYVIRFCVCQPEAKPDDIHYAYRCISAMATELLDLVRQGKERIRAISQQNTIDVSSLSLHRQQSASADRAPATELEQQPAAAQQQVLAQTPARLGAKSPLLKQASVLESLAQQTAAEEAELTAQEDLEQEISLLGDDYDELDDDDLIDEVLASQAGAGSAGGLGQPSGGGVVDQDEWRSPVARRAGRSTGGAGTGGQPAAASQELDEAEDEVFTLAERRNRMSLRYKREFFVRVVSDPRVYRASISGDINAHASCCSLGAGNSAPHDVAAEPVSRQ